VFAPKKPAKKLFNAVLQRQKESTLPPSHGKKYYLRLISKQSIFALQLTVTPLMHLKCPRIQTAGLLCAPDDQKNSPEQQRIGKHKISIAKIGMQ
jgi:hypothetical protein